MDKASRIIAHYDAEMVKGHVPVGSMLERLILFHRWLMLGLCRIRDVHAEEIALIPNRCQRILLSKMLGQAARGKPIRMVVLKARKTGVSTFVQALFVFLSATYPRQRCLMIAHAADSTDEIFTIGRDIGKSWAWALATATERLIRFGDKSSPTASRYLCHTAGGPGVGAGGTPNNLHFSELALWTLNKAQTEYTARNSVPAEVPTTVIVYESTARGKELFWAKFDDARRGKIDYDGVFIPWYFDERNVSPIGRDAPIGELDEEEIALRHQARAHGIELTLEALQWRRKRIADNGLYWFRQEFPATPEEAVSAAKGHVLPGLTECVIQKLPFEYSRIMPEEKVGGWDHGFQDAAVLLTGVFRDNTLYVIAIHRCTQTLARNQAVFVVGGHTYYCDPAALQARKELAAASSDIGTGATFVKAPRRKGEVETSVVKAEWEMVVALIREGRLKILEGAHEQLLLEGDSFFYHETTGKPHKHRKIPECGDFDTVDALKYMVMGVTTVTDIPDDEPDEDDEESRRDQFRG